MKAHLATMPAEFWTGLWSAVGLIGVALIPSVVTLVTAYWKREEEKKARTALQTSVDTVGDKVDEAKVEGGNREARLSDKIDENTTLTTDVKKLTEKVKTHLETTPEQRTAMALARMDGEPVFYDMHLPGVDYEPFMWSVGALVEWKQEYCERGRQVRFKSHGESSIGFHWHTVTEITFGVAGKLTYELHDIVVEIHPGEVYTAAPDQIHRASFDAAGMAVVHWPEQESDILKIGLFVQPETPAAG